MSAHTPGPWDFQDMRDCFDKHIAIRPHGQGFLLASLSSESFTYGAGGHDIDANAHLIAAAPDMLDMLKRCAELLDDYSDVNDGEDGPRPNRAMSLLTDVEAIIAKAEGR